MERFKVAEFHKRANFQVCWPWLPIVKLAIQELGEREVRNIAYESFGNGGFENRYEKMLGARLGDIYISDTSKTYLKKYVVDKFSADLGL